jgi:hypothetical protein
VTKHWKKGEHLKNAKGTLLNQRIETHATAEPGELLLSGCSSGFVFKGKALMCQSVLHNDKKDF